MIIADLPCLEYWYQKEILGGKKYSYGNGVAFAFTGSHTDGFDISAVVGKYRDGLNVSAFSSKPGKGFDVSAVAGTSIYVGHGYVHSHSFSHAQSPSY